MTLNVISQMVLLFIIVGVGYLCAKLGYLDRHVSGALNKMLLNVTLPCMMVASAVESHGLVQESSVLLLLVSTVVLFGLLLVAGLIIDRIIRVPKGQRPFYLFMSICLNIGFMGIPIAQAVYGSAGVFLLSLVVMLFGVLLFSFGIAILSRGDPAYERFEWKKMITPGLIAGIVALVLFFTGVQLPGILNGALTAIGNITSPVAMMLVGASLVGMAPYELITEHRLYLYTLLRQLVLPLIVLFCLHTVFPDTTVFQILILTLAMPVGVMLSVFALQYHADVELATKAIVISTVCSFITIPVVMTVMASVI